MKTLDIVAGPELTDLDAPAFYAEEIAAAVRLLGERPLPAGTAASNDTSNEVLVLDAADSDVLDAAATRFDVHSSSFERQGESVVATTAGWYARGVDEKSEREEPIAFAIDVTGEFVFFGSPRRPLAGRVVFHTRDAGHRVMWLWDRGPGADLLHLMAEKIAYAELRWKLRDA